MTTARHHHELWDAATLDPEWPFDLLATRFRLEEASTALLIVDVQTGDLSITPDSEMGRRHPSIADYWNTRIESVVIPTICRLIGEFRSARRPVVYTRNGFITPTGHEMTERLRPSLIPPAYHRGTPGYEIDARISPEPGDVVVDKLTSGAFTATYLDHSLRNLGVNGVVVAGIVTDMCVLGTARSAAELGYRTLICEDGCASYTQRAHEEALLCHARTFGRIARASEVIAELRSPG